MKPITYKDNASELVPISVKEAMQMLMDNEKLNIDMGKLPERSGKITGEQWAHDFASSLKVSKPDPVVVLDECGNELELIGVTVRTRGFFVNRDESPCADRVREIYRREEYVLSYNGEKLPPLPDGYGLVPGGTAVPINSDKWRALFPPELQIEEGKWYECGDGSVVMVIGDGGPNSAHMCSDRAIRLKNGEVLIPCARENGQIIREINPQLSLSDLDHATANRVWRAMK